MSDDLARQSHPEPPSWWLLRVDLTGSKLGPEWRTVDVTLDLVDWPPERIRAEAAAHYGVPLEQVGQPHLFTEPVIPDPPPADFDPEDLGCV